MSLKELSEFFGISYAAMRVKRTKENKLKILSVYADWHLEGRNIYIDNIILD
jgi:hypothetical protein